MDDFLDAGPGEAQHDLPHWVLGLWFGVDRSTIRAIGEIRALLAGRGCTVPDRSGLRLPVGRVRLRPGTAVVIARTTPPTGTTMPTSPRATTSRTPLSAPTARPPTAPPARRAQGVWRLRRPLPSRHLAAAARALAVQQGQQGRPHPDRSGVHHLVPRGQLVYRPPRRPFLRCHGRLVEHRSLRRSRQDLRVATACSTRARIFAWDRFTAFWPAERVSRRPQHGMRTVPPAPR